jgi:hypothetical protein
MRRVKQATEGSTTAHHGRPRPDLAVLRDRDPHCAVMTASVALVTFGFRCTKTYGARVAVPIR